MSETRSVKPVTINTGIVHSEEEDLFQPVLCKPKLMPLKSVTLRRLEEMQRFAEEKLKEQQQEQETGAGEDEPVKPGSNQF